MARGSYLPRKTEHVAFIGVSFSRLGCEQTWKGGVFPSWWREGVLDRPPFYLQLGAIRLARKHLPNTVRGFERPCDSNLPRKAAPKVADRCGGPGIGRAKHSCEWPGSLPFHWQVAHEGVVIHTQTTRCLLSPDYEPLMKARV